MCTENVNLLKTLVRRAFLRNPLMLYQVIASFDEPFDLAQTVAVVISTRPQLATAWPKLSPTIRATVKS